MSHKTGKRVLATTATSALAFAGLIAMPLSAHAAAADVTLTNVCGGPSDAAVVDGLDYVTFPANSGVYTVGGVTVNTGSTPSSPASTVNAIAYDADAIAVSVAMRSADGTKVNYYLPVAVYTITDPVTSIKSVPGTLEIYDAVGTKVDSAVISAAKIDNATCSVSSIPAPTQKNNTGSAGGTITVTKGTGIKWTVVEAGTPSITGYVDGDEIVFDAGASPSATKTLTVTDGAAVQLQAEPAAGYTGLTKTFDFQLDQKTVVAYVAPLTQDRDGKESDTFSVRNIPGIDWYYALDGTTWTGTNTVPTVGFTKVDFQSGETTASITRDSAEASGDEIEVVAVLNDTTPPSPAYKWDAADNTPTAGKVTTVTWTDDIKIRSLPAPEMVNGDGASDYYVLPQVDGVTWTVRGGGTTATYQDNDPRLGTQVQVYTYGAASQPVTYTFTATEKANSDYVFDTTVTKTEWTFDYDSRRQVTPAPPAFVDNSGLLQDAVTFPSLGEGLTGYKIGIADTAANAKAASDLVVNSPRYVDSSWYGKTVLLTDLQRTMNITDITHSSVYIEALPNQSVTAIATDADGNPVKSSWAYTFTNAVNVIPEPPIVDDQPGTANDTLTFPTDPRVNYRVTQGGVTRTISYADRGKPLPYTGTVTITPVAATGFLLQPKGDGTAPDPWVFTFDASLGKVTPQAPQSHDRSGTDQDTYVVPNQPGVLWSVDGVDLDPSQYGKEIATGGKLTMNFVARAAQGYSLADGAETEFFLHWNPQAPTGEVTIDHTILDNGYQADVEWSGPEDAEGVTYTVEFAKVTQDEDGDEVLGTLQTWKEDTEETGGRFSAGYGVTYKIYVTATDEHGTESDTVSEYISFPEDSRGTESRWTDINRSTVTPSGNDALGWYQVGSSLYFNNTAFVTYRDQSNITFTVNGGQQLRVYGTQYTKGGRALIQVNGTNWAWLDAGASSNADPYKKMLRQINLPNTGTHTIKIIASLLPGKELALDAYEVVK